MDSPNATGLVNDEPLRKITEQNLDQDDGVGEQDESGEQLNQEPAVSMMENKYKSAPVTRQAANQNTD